MDYQNYWNLRLIIFGVIELLKLGILFFILRELKKPLVIVAEADGQTN